MLQMSALPLHSRLYLVYIRKESFVLMSFQVIQQTIAP